MNDFPVPTSYSGPQGITTGPDGNFWFTEYFANQIGRITPVGVITEFPLPTPNAGPWGIVAGPDGNLWFTERRAFNVGRITPQGVVTEFASPTGIYPLDEIAAGPDGNLWFTSNGPTICRITTAGAISQFSVPSAGPLPGIAAGPDGNLWFTETGSQGDPSAPGKIGRITTAGIVTEFPVPPELSNPVSIATGSDGNLWFAGFAAAIGRITPSGDFTTFPFPPPTQVAIASHGIANGPDGNLWYFGARLITGGVDTYIARVTPSGVITEFHSNWGQDITGGPDGNLWFTAGDGVRQLVLSTAPAPGRQFFTVTPCRLLDTRTAAGPSGGPTLEAGAVRTFPAANLCSIPSSARAIVANVTVTNAGADGSLLAYAGTDPPPATDSVSFRSGVTRANNGIIRLGTDGSIAIQCLSTQGADVILDVSGFFE